MKFTLTDYQVKATSDVITELREAAAAYEGRGRMSAIGLTAPTGAGKTVIATAVLEGLMFGTEDTDANRDLAVLWLTDDPALNAQTANKMLLASSRFTDGHLVTIDNTFDERTFAPGKVYFCHIQQLGRGATSYHAAVPDRDGNVMANDHRTHGLWDTIANTVRARGANLLVVRDEAHRGTGNGAAAKQTIVNTVVHGGTTPIGTHQPPAPLVLGISATPERFYESMSAREAQGTRTVTPVSVDANAVRESGMLKDRILVKHPGEAQIAEDTLLQQAVQDLMASDAAWRAHYEATGDSLVEPILVVQVPPAVPDTKVAAILDTLALNWPILTNEAVAHSFGEHSTLRIGDRQVRYVSPESITDDDRVRVVLFKDALTTGWDCPRAEVMLSLRAAADYTNIAQLIGRMVRTPLARRIETDESLNDVTMYLPYYDPENVEKVVEALAGETVAPPQVVINPVVCPANPAVPQDVFDLLASLPSYVRPKRAYRSNVARLIALADLLAEKELEAAPTATVKARMIAAVRTEDDAHRHAVDKRVADNLELLMTERAIAGGTFTVIDDEEAAADAGSAEPQRRRVTRRDLADAYNKARRVMPDATADWYYGDLCDNQGYDDEDAMARVAALSTLDGVIDAVEAAAATQIDAWKRTHKTAVERGFTQAVQTDFKALWEPTKGGMAAANLDVPESVKVATEKVSGDTLVPVKTYPRHAFALPAGHPNAGDYPAPLGSTWEQGVLEEELTFDSLVGWYRNPSSGKHALSIPYEHGGEEGLLHPDFLFFHQIEDEGLSLDIVDPHLHNSADTGPKWAGLARWAQTKPERVRRVVAVIKVDDRLQSLDLTRNGIAERLDKATTKPQVEALFDELGDNY
ncbi:DEAD/DEAH box helicase family protein [Blastococcus saxobsidens]|uniref:DEAD/DEAH box helicase family protein n=1 Tax=Blastococcus saxobsidens TaxID=138336 RepID=A0A6L9W4N2_9ACTN|nr:DEAD/DEAH box helicase family protein [Blastococcus saxobsidens]